jgi:hypothetical protein
MQATSKISAPLLLGYLSRTIDDAPGINEAVPAQARKDVTRHLPQRRIRASPTSAGFFTLAFSIAVLAVSSLIAGAMGTRRL